MASHFLTPQDVELIRRYGQDEAASEALIAHFDQRLQETAQATHRHLVKTLEHLYTFVGMLSTDGLLLDANPLAFEVAGIQPETVLNKPFSEAYWWAHSGEVRAQIEDAVRRAAEGETVRHEITAQVRGGELLLIDFTLSPYRSEHDRVLYLIPVANDITEARREEHNLRLSEHRFRSFFENAPIGMAIGTGRGELYPVQVNQALCDFLEYDRETLEGVTGYDMLDMISHPDDLKLEKGYIHEIGAGSREGYQFEKRYFTASGKLVWGELTTIVTRDERDNISQTISMVVDITRRKEAESALRYSETLYRTLIQNLPNTAMLAFDNDLRFILVEGPLLERTGFRKEETEGRTIWEVLPEKAAKELEPYYRRALAGEIIHFVRQTADGKQYDSYFYPMVSSSGMSGGLLVVHDITDLVEADKQRLALERERSRILSEFITKASHEFRTPLAIIGTNAYLVRRAENESRRNNHAKMIEEQVSFLSLLIDRMLTMTRINNTRQFERSPHLLHRLVNRAIDHRQAQLQEKSLQLDVEFDQTLRVEVDSNRFIDALAEVLINAIQHTPENSQLALRSYYDDARDMIALEIQDEGHGISEAHLPYIFEQFYRGDSAHTTRGFGLGLAIAHRIIHLHSGTINARNLQSGGTMFTIHLPRHNPLSPPME